MRRYIFYFWTSDKADDYVEQYGLSIDDAILKHKTDCMIFGTKIGEFDNLKDAINYANHYINTKSSNDCSGIYDNEERDWIKDW